MTTDILINRYKVLERLGEGAMGAVWLVEDSTNQQLLAMKVLSSQMAGGEKSFLQLKQEFRLMTQLRHPNCCAVYDYGQLPEGSPYLTMELVPGQGLDEMLPLAPDEFRSILSQLLLAIGYVHQLGYVHSDLKSQNVRVKPDGTVKLMDYGLMELAGRSGAPIKGTLAYMAPEVVKRGPIDRRADLYALGALAYEMICGKPPFTVGGAMDILRAHVSDTPRPLSQVTAGVDPLLERIVMKLLEKEPIDRYQSAYEVLADLGVEAPAGIGGNLLTSPMVGRDSAIGELQEQLTAIAKWQPGGAVLITGDAGIGKSRLLEEFRYLVQVEDLLYAVGTLSEQAATPYGPMVEILRKLLPSLREHTGAELAAQAPVLVKLLPELGSAGGHPELVPAPDLDPPVREKLRLQATVSDLLVSLAHAQPLVLALEDWQWADPLSGELLEYLLRNTREASILFVVTSRSVPEAVAGWGERVMPISLSGLDARGTWRMVTSMLGSDAVGARFMSQVAEFSSGNPFLIERLLEHLVRNQVLVSEKGRWNTQLELAREQLPKDLGTLLLAKLADLSAGAQELARAAATIGSGITLELLQNITGWQDDVLFDAIAELQGATVLEADENGGYRFAQEQLLDMLYASVPQKEKTRLHSALVGALEHRIWGKELHDLTFEDVRALAFHSLKGNVADKTIVYALETGIRSLGLNATATAEQFLSDGLALVRLEAGGRWKKHLLDYMRYLADTYRTASKHVPARELLLEAIPLGEELGKHLLVGRMLTSLAKSCMVLTDYVDAQTYSERSVQIAASIADRAGEARAQMTLGRVHFFKGRLAEALLCAEQAVNVSRESGDATILAGAFAMGGYFYVASGEPDKLEQGVRNLDEAVALLEQAGDKLGLINSLGFLGNAQVMLGDFLDAWGTFSRMRLLAYEGGSKDDEIVAIVNLATTALELGNVSESVERAREARELVEKRGSSKYAKGLAVVVEALSSLYAGKPAKSRVMAQNALDFVREIKNKYVEALALPYQMEVLIQLGRLAEAKAIGESLQALIAETGNTEPEGRLNVLFADVLARQGDTTLARTYAQRALDGAIAAQSKGLQVRAQRQLAAIDLLDEAWDTAWERATAALQLATRIGAKAQAQELSGLLGELALASRRKPREAEENFRVMEVISRQTDVKQALAQAMFGLAACFPDQPGAATLCEEAAAGLRALAGMLDEEEAGHFLSLAERQQVMLGARHAYSLPRRLSDRGRALWLKLEVFYRSSRSFD